MRHTSLRVLIATALATTFLSCAPASAQGTFQNLDFEQANVPVVPSGQFGSDVLSTDGVPGWTTYMGGAQVNTVLHNNVTLSGTGDIYGSVLGLTVNMTGTSAIHYDLALDSNNGTISLAQ